MCMCSSYKKTINKATWWKWIFYSPCTETELNLLQYQLSAAEILYSAVNLFWMLVKTVSCSFTAGSHLFLNGHVSLFFFFLSLATIAFRTSQDFFQLSEAKVSIICRSVFFPATAIIPSDSNQTQSKLLLVPFTQKKGGDSYCSI